MAGGSQIIINKDGIKIITPAKFEAKAGQHLFKSGTKINYELPLLPDANQIDRKSMRFDLGNLDYISDFSKAKYRVYKNNDSFYEGFLDTRGRTKRFFSEELEELEIFLDHPDFIVEEDFFIESNDSQEYK